MNTKAKWNFKNGSMISQWDSFPFAYRAMYNEIRRGIEKGIPLSNMTNAMSITGPISPGIKPSRYTYHAATQKANDAGIVNTEGIINSKEFKRY